MNVFLRATIAATTILLAPLGAAAQHEHDHGAAEKLGHVSFPISCKVEVRETFERGVALLHSFAYAKASQTSPRWRRRIRGAPWRSGGSR